METGNTFENFIKEFKLCLKDEFDNWNKDDLNFTSRGYPKEMISRIMKHKPLSVAIAKEYGGRGIKVSDCLSILEAASYESLALSLMFGINIALFLEPFYRYGDDLKKAYVFDRFINHQAMGGLMISEPNHGSDALNMQTSCTKFDDYAHLEGTKHWQGLTGMADFWLIACREKASSGHLMKDITMFISDSSKDEQKIEVEEYYRNNGLYAIPYGKNILDLKIPYDQQLTPTSSGIKMLMDTLHRSRMQFPGMGLGFLKRIMEEAIKHCQTRMVRGNCLMQFDQVNYQLLQLQSAFTVCSAMCHRSCKISSVENDLALEGMESNIIKAYTTDLMQNSAHTLVQLQGANGYKIENLGSRGIMDSRPFRIFEGPNEMLFSQISEALIKGMRRKSETNLYTYLKEHPLCSLSAPIFKKDIDFSIDYSILQRKHVVLGEILTRIVCTNYVIEIKEAGFNNELADTCIANLKQEVSHKVSSFNSFEKINPVEDFVSNASWSNLQSSPELIV